MRLRLAIPILVALLSLSWGTVSLAEVEQAGNLRVTFNAGFAPRSLPRDRPAPVKVEVEGRIATTDGTRPPPLRWLEISLHRSGRLFTRGLPICAAATLQSVDSRAALERCRPALVGRGKFRAEVTLGKEILTTGDILVFNSRPEGRPAMVLHLFASIPVRYTLVVPLTIGRKPDGQFGTVLRARIPKLGGGLGSITQIDLSIWRRFSFGGVRRSYVSAACGAPAGLPGAIFNFARGSFRFEGHEKIESTLVRDCSVR